MPYTNTFFSNTTGYETEVNLLDDLVIEQINISGVDLIYLPRKLVNYDDFLNDATKSAFEIGLPMPMYIKNFSGYNQGMEVLTKFGVSNTEELTLIMSKSLFTTHYAPFLNAYYQAHSNLDPTESLDSKRGETAFRPKEGDLIFFPFDRSFFEIKYVTPDDPFFQFGRGYVYELQTEKFVFSGQTFDTSIEEIDGMRINASYYKLEFNTLSTGTGTFLINEEVKIYKYNQIQHPINPPESEIKPFDLGNTESLLENVPFITGTVISWDKPKNDLIIGNLSDEDPTFLNPVNQDTSANKLDVTIIVGQQSQAVYYTESANEQDTPFDDKDQIQPEFDRMKIMDEDDEFAFGFI
jgi:hypothetical protein